MKAVLLMVACLAAGAMAMARTDYRQFDDTSMVTMDIKQRQLVILKLLNHVMEPLMYKELEDIGKSFKIEENTEMFTKTEVVKQFVKMLKVGFLPRGEIFTIHIDRQLKEVVSMFHMLYYAKDFDTFIKTACWMRLYLNEGMFVYALTVAVRHRQDCKGIILPPPYEIYPYFYVRADVIQKAYLLKMKKGLLDLKLCDFYGIKKTDKDVYVIDENIYDKRNYLNEEDALRYFTEDIDLNTYYYYFHVDYPFWMKDTLHDKSKIRRYEVTMYMYQQILARYYLERLSHRLGPIRDFSWHKTIQKGYWPWMTFHNGVEIPVRHDNYVIARDDNMDVIRLADEYENIIRHAIMNGYIEVNGKRFELTKAEDMELFGKLIFGKYDKMDMDRTDIDRFQVDCYRYMMIVMKAALGLNTFRSDKYFVVPSALDHYQTALRDPVFYQLQKRIVDLMWLFKRRLPCYTKEELYYPGVKIDNVVVDRLVTYFDDYFMDISNAVSLTEEEIRKTKGDMTFWVRKRRLNHQPFRITVDVTSEKAADSVVRIFLGPKRDHLDRLIDINRNRQNFVELDTFLYKLVTGKNTIVRNSVEMHNMVQDRIMTHDLMSKVETVTDFKDLLLKDLRNYHTGFPTRLLLPRGHIGGMEMMVYVIITPLRPVDNIDINTFDPSRKELVWDFRSTVLLDKMPLGFPFDRRIDVENFYTPNMRFVDVMIFHKTTTCDMKTRWNHWVLKNYDMVDQTNMQSQTYHVDTDVDQRQYHDNSYRDF